MANISCLCETNMNLSQSENDKINLENISIIHTRKLKDLLLVL